MIRETLELMIGWWELCNKGTLFDLAYISKVVSYDLNSIAACCIWTGVSVVACAVDRIMVYNVFRSPW